MLMNHDEFGNFQPVDFLNIALELEDMSSIPNSQYSAIKRTIFSRTYYATFLSIRELLNNNTEYISNPFGEHRRIANYIEFKGPFANDLNRKVAKYLRILKKLRVQSDYFLEVPPMGTKSYEDWLFYNTEYALNISRRLIKLFANHFNN